MFLSCTNDDTTEDIISNNDISEIQEKTSGYTLALKTTGGDEIEFIVNTDDIMSGEITAENNGIELPSWRFFYPVGETLFTTGYSEDNACVAYVDNGEGIVVEKSRFVFENSLEMFGASDDEKTFLAMETPRGTGYTNARLHFIDEESGFVTKIISTKIFIKEHTGDDPIEGQVAWPTALQVRGDKLFIPYNVLDAKGWFTTPDPDKAYVAIYSYPSIGNEPEKIIEDDRTSNIGVNGTTNGLIEADNGDLYSFSCGSVNAGFSPASTKPSGILKINSGETEFDQDYFLNIEEATNGGKIFTFDYVGNNKALARILAEDTGIAWDAYTRDETAFNQRLVIIDLEAKTVTDVADVPLHAIRYTSPTFIEDGKAYVSIETATDAHIYQIDIATATGVKGAKIIGKTVKGIFKL